MENVARWQIVVLLFITGIMWSGCIAPPSPNNLTVIVESNNAPECIKLSTYSKMLLACELCTDFVETPVIELKNECSELLILHAGSTPPPMTGLNDYYEGSKQGADGTTLTYSGESAYIYVHQLGASQFYFIQKSNPQQSSPNVYEIKYRIENKSK
ncbi:MAG: hypothetical protein Q8P05_00465 [Candidatus Diapherotrites archaeon]|nr:hypothetical protein [Candidatus Diapherotrites archaeon]